MIGALNAMVGAATPAVPVEGLFGIPWLSLAGVAGGGTFVAVLAILRLMLVNGLPWFKQLTENRAAVRTEERGDLHDCHARLDKVEAQMTTMTNRTHSVEMRLVSALTAVTILATELQRLAPGSSALRSAKRLLLAAYPVEDEMPAFIADILKPLEDVE